MMLYTHTMKLIFRYFVFISLNLLLQFSANAQINTRREVLLSMGKQLDIKARNNFSEAVVQAKEKNWSLSYTSKNNRIAKLMGLDQNGWPKYFITYADPTQAITVGANKIWPGGVSGINLNGSSDSLTNKMGIWDEGAPRTTHKELNGRITIKDNASSNALHSTHVTGIIMSQGLNTSAKGMVYGLKGALSYDWNTDESEMASAAASGLLISNHSYGIVCGWDYNTDSSRWEFNGHWNEKEDYRFGLYDASAQLLDSIMFNAPNYLIVKSAGNSRNNNGPKKDATGKWVNNDSTYWRRDQNGKWYNAGLRPDSLSSNDGYDILPYDINAKNPLIVGAIAGIPAGYNKVSDAVMTSFSDWGPTDDGRIKPDIVADGVSVFSTTNTNDSSYGYLSGTSMSSPGVSGSLLLLQELSYKINNKPLHAATIKALAIHSANEAGLNLGPDYQFGWGLLNINEATKTLNNALSSNNGTSSNDLVYEDVINNNTTKTYTITASGKSGVKATIAWIDPKGTASNTLNDPSKKLVHDLDIKIVSNGKTTYPWTLSPTVPAAAATKGINSLDNIEKVEIDSTIAGQQYVITITHKGTLERGSQAYSLVISGAGGATYCSSTPTATTGTKLDSVSLNNIQYVNSANKEYLDNTNYIITAEQQGSLNYYIRTNSVDATNANRFIKIFIDLNSNGIFESSEELASSAVLTNAGVFNGTITIPNTVSAGQLTRLRIVAMETSAAANVLACGNYTVGETQDYTLKFKNPSNDLQLAELVNPQANACTKGTQYVTVKLNNLGGTDQTGFPITLTVKKGTTTILTTTEIFDGTLAAYDNMHYTFQKPISIEPNTSYTFTANVNLTTDQNKDNNSLTSTITSAAAIVAPIAVASNCNNTIQYSISDPNSGANYYWYDTTATTNPIAVGSSGTTTSNLSKLYVTKGYQNFITPANNTTLGNTGGYNVFSGNYVKITANSPLTIETAKLYTAYPGKIDFILGTFATDNADGSYSYYPIQTVTLNVGSSSPTPTSGSSSFNAADTGRTYFINLNVPAAGSYIIIIKSTNAAIFRNNSLGNSTYPLGPSQVFSFTGNSVPASSGNFQNYFYFFYNTQINTNDCQSPMGNANIVTVNKPILTQNSDTTLSSSVAAAYQWYMNDSAIIGATSQSYKVNRNALYKVQATTNGCQIMSDPKLILVTDVMEANVKEIQLKIYADDFIENVIGRNSFFIQFSNVQTQDISVDLLNSMGERVFRKDHLINQMAPQRIDINNLNTGVYFVKVYANNKVYTQRVFVR